MEHICATLDDPITSVIGKVHDMDLDPADYDVENLVKSAYEQRPEAKMQYALAMTEEDIEGSVTDFLLTRGA